MFRIYITAKALADVYLQESSKEYKRQSEWFRILLKQHVIYITGYSEPEGDYLKEDDTTVSAYVTEMSISYNIRFVSSDDYINSIKSDHKRVYDHPNSAFFIDVDPEVAAQIQEKYGVICQSTNEEIDTSVFTDECMRVEFRKNKKTENGWREIFEVQANYPSNALCIVDRFLFTYDGQFNRNKRFSSERIFNGLDTIQLILLNALPKTFSSTYHVTIICEKKAIGKKEIKDKNENAIKKYDTNCFIFQTFQQELFNRIEIVSSIKGYPILAQLLAVDDSEAPYTHELTHNRQIVSNYHRMTLPNGVNAIRYYNGSEGTVEYTQPIQGEMMYSTGLKIQNSACPVHTINSFRDIFNEVLLRWNTSYEPGHYFYADNSGNSSIRNLENRFLL